MIMKKIFSIFTIFLLSIIAISPFIALAHAADIRGDNVISISKDEKDLSDIYLFGNSIAVEAPVKNDLVAAGQDIIIDNNTSGNIMAAGATLRIRGENGGSVRVAGGNVVIDGKVGRDLLVAGGSVTISKTATIAGDLLIAGGEIVIKGKVNGKAIINGGNVNLDGTIDKKVEGNVGQLTIGSSAVIGGNLNYSSPEKAVVERGAVIRGTQHFTRIEKPKEDGKQISDFLGTVSVYKLVGDIILSIALIFFLGKFIQTISGKIVSGPFGNFIKGLAFIILMPLISIFLLILLLPGIASFIFYFLILVFGVYLAKIFIGWLVLRWWYNRYTEKYVLDWKAGIAGPLILFVAALIPVIGWLFAAILYLITIGALIQELAVIARGQRILASSK